MLFLWIVSCILIGFLGRLASFNFWQGFVLSIMLTPPGALLGIIVCGSWKEANT